MFETRCIIYISKKRLGKYGTDGIELSINDISKCSQIYIY